MKRSAIAATFLVGVATLGGATAAPAVGPSDSASAQTHTRKFVLHETASRDIGRRNFVGTDKVRPAATREVVGFDTISGSFSRKTGKVTVDVALSLKGGIVLGRVRGTFETEPIIFRGPILKGTGKYAGIEGSFTVTLARNDNAFLTAKYRL